ncbi:Nickel-cobalt-cadmium resistance protein NccB [uncultured Defluviicoccus sp.]|uniref:Nickel-cobalt-cadmium resistance protein NccB n=1 Tax=metagenome TaxID=256318 RepID=A0A380T992_9ZZZZ|nr:Nickel-cobalt-cadmium resistance protein NccB [uncultured Defluviicoccus sp.]
MKRNLLIAAAAAGVFVVGAGGVLLGQTIFDPHKAASGADAHEEEGHEEEGHGGAEGVEMSAEQIASSNIELTTAQLGAMTGGIETQGSIVAGPEGLAVLSARSAGSVAAISKRLGDPVARGEVLARIQSGDGAALAAARAAAESKAQVARSAFEREKRLFDAKVTAKQDYEAAQQALTTAEAELASAVTAMNAAGVSDDGRYVLVRSPIAGRITSSRATLGAYVDANAELFRVADPTKVQIETALTAADAVRVRPGDQASVIVTGATFEATVRSVTPSLDADSRTATAVLNLDGKASNVQPGQFVRVRISPRAAPTVSTSVIIPEEAVQSFEGNDVVFVRTQDGFEAKPVSVGARSGGRAEVLSGIKAGDVVAGKNAFLVKAEIGKGEAEHGH